MDLPGGKAQVFILYRRGEKWYLKGHGQPAYHC